MAITVKVKPYVASIKVKSKDGGGILATNPVFISTSVNPVDRFDELKDVIEGDNPETGEVAVYNAENDKYEVKRLDFDDLVGDVDLIDAGEFN